MKRSKPLQRKTPMKRGSFKPRSKTWPKKTRALSTTKPKEMAKRTTKRSKEERAYVSSVGSFLTAHPVCPVTGERTNQVHHSAKRQGGWLNLKRYWIAVSTDGHAWIEANKKEAEKYHLMVRINETFKEHCDKLLEQCENLDFPVFYIHNPELPLVNEITRQPLWTSRQTS